MSCLRLCIWMGLAITWVTAPLIFFFFFVHVIWIHNCLSLKLALHTRSVITKWAEILIPNIHFGAACGKQYSVLSLLSFLCERWWRSRGDFTLDTALPRLPADRTLWFSSAHFWDSPGPNLCSKGFSCKYTIPSGSTCLSGQLDHVLKSLTETGQWWLCLYFVVKLEV